MNLSDPVIVTAAVILFLILMIAGGRKRSWKKRHDTNYEPSQAVNNGYRVVPSLLTDSELEFYRVLTQAVDVDHVVQSKVRIADLITVNQSVRAWQKTFNQIASKHADFVVCDKNTLRPLVVIELDDSSHAKLDRQQRDQFVNDVYSIAGIPIVHIPTSSRYHLQNIRHALISRMHTLGVR
jgi:hypothetical protein